MDTQFESPISDSDHHNKVSNGGKKPNAGKVVFVIAAILVFLIGLGAFFFVAVEAQPEEATTNSAPAENY